MILSPPQIQGNFFATSGLAAAQPSMLDSPSAPTLLDRTSPLSSAQAPDAPFRFSFSPHPQPIPPTEPIPFASSDTKSFSPPNASHFAADLISSGRALSQCSIENAAIAFSQPLISIPQVPQYTDHKSTCAQSVFTPLHHMPQHPLDMPAAAPTHYHPPPTKVSLFVSQWRSLLPYNVCDGQEFNPSLSKPHETG
jgi:hypothetical protein